MTVAGRSDVDRLPGGARAPADGRMQPHEDPQQPAGRCARAAVASRRRRRPQRDHPAIHPTADEGGLGSVEEDAELGERGREHLQDLLGQEDPPKRRDGNGLVEGIPLPVARRHLDRDGDELRSSARQGRDRPGLEEPERAAGDRPLDVLGAPEMLLDPPGEIADRPGLFGVQDRRPRWTPRSSRPLPPPTARALPRRRRDARPALPPPR